MPAFELDTELLNHAFRLGRVGSIHVLLGRNADVPWFMLVPEVEAVELCDLSAAEHAAVMTLAHRLGRAIREEFECDKLNVAAIGNIVRQLHVHVVGRRRDDPHWPGVIWGAKAVTEHDAESSTAMSHWLSAALAPDFVVTHG